MGHSGAAAALAVLARVHGDNAAAAAHPTVAATPNDRELLLLLSPRAAASRLSARAAGDALVAHCGRLRDATAAATTAARRHALAAAFDHAADAATVLLAAALEDAASAAAVSVASHVSFWRQRDGRGSVLLALFGPLRGYLRGRVLQGAVRVADVLEGGPFDWLVGAHWGARELAKAALRGLARVPAAAAAGWALRLRVERTLRA